MAPGSTTSKAPDWRRQAIKEKIAHNETEVEKTKAHLQMLESQRYELLEALNSTSRIMTALSPEILSEIFLMACQYSSGIYSTPKQFRLGRVCRAWRRIAWSTPRLWCAVSICFKEKCYEVQRVLFEEWIRRSGSCPLKLEVTVESYNTQWEQPLDSTLQYLMTTCQRWKALEVYNNPNFAQALTQSRREFPLLEVLQINRMRDKHDKHLTGWDFFSATPRLHDLDTSFSAPGTQLGVNWASLVKLRITFSFRFISSLEILSSLSSLVTLDCSLEQYNATFNANMVSLPNLPQLSSLSVDGHPKLVVTFLRLLTAPKLAKLEVSCEFVSSRSLWTDAVFELVQRSSCQLTNFTVYQCNQTDEGQILDFLRKLSPALETFSFQCSSKFTLSDRFIKELNLSLPENKPRRQECLPNLKCFYYYGDVSLSLRNVLKMLESRRRSKRQELDDENDEEEPENGDEEENEEVEEKSQEAVPEGQDEDDATSTNSDESIETRSNTSQYEFRLGIQYSNLSWYQGIKPDKMQKFLDRVATFASDAVTLDLEWYRPDDDDGSEDLWSEDSE